MGRVSEQDRSDYDSLPDWEEDAQRRASGANAQDTDLAALFGEDDLMRRPPDPFEEKILTGRNSFNDLRDQLAAEDEPAGEPPAGEPPAPSHKPRPRPSRPSSLGASRISELQRDTSTGDEDQEGDTGAPASSSRFFQEASGTKKAPEPAPKAEVPLTPAQQRIAELRRDLANRRAALAESASGTTEAPAPRTPPPARPTQRPRPARPPRPTPIEAVEAELAPPELPEPPPAPPAEVPPPERPKAREQRRQQRPKPAPPVEAPPAGEEVPPVTPDVKAEPDVPGQVELPPEWEVTPEPAEAAQPETAPPPAEAPAPGKRRPSKQPPAPEMAPPPEPAPAVPAAPIRLGASGGDAAVVQGLTQVYGAGPFQVEVLHDVSFSLKQAQMTAVLGPPGAGKTALLNCVSGLDQVTSGTVVVAGEDISAANEQQRAKFRSLSVGFIFEEFNLLPTLSVNENILLPLAISKQPLDQAWYDQIISAVRLTSVLSAKPADLTPAQRQRAGFARAVMGKPAIVIADEPTSRLTGQEAADFVDLLRAGVDELGLTVLIATSDPVIASRTGRVLFLSDGNLVSDLASPTLDKVVDAWKTAVRSGFAS